MQKIIHILGICLLAGVVIYFLAKDVEGISVTVDDDYLSLSYSASSSFDIQYVDILSVIETQDLNLGKFVSGTQTKNYWVGIWDDNEFGEYNLCIYANVKRYIVVKTSEGMYVLNLESIDATDNFYQAFMEFLQTKQAESAP